MNLPWFRMYTEAVDDPKLRLLAFEDRWHFIAILCCKGQGIIDTNPELLDRMLAVKLGVQGRELDEIKRRLMEVGLVDEYWQPTAWGRRQFVSDQDPTNADRQRRYRERHNGSHNVTVTLTDTDTDTEQNRQETTHAGFQPAPKLPNCPKDEIVNLYHEFLPMCPRVQKWTDARERLLRARWREHPAIDLWKQYFAIVKRSKFLTGKANSHGERRPFLADFEWLIKPGNFVKVLEGRYDDVKQVS